MFRDFINPNYTNFFNVATPLLIVFIVWSSIWKGAALWKSARKTQHIWFIAILLTNTLGILEIVYLSFFQKKASKKK